MGQEEGRFCWTGFFDNFRYGLGLDAMARPINAGVSTPPTCPTRRPVDCFRKVKLFARAAEKKRENPLQKTPHTTPPTQYKHTHTHQFAHSSIVHTQSRQGRERERKRGACSGGCYYCYLCVCVRVFQTPRFFFEFLETPPDLATSVVRTLRYLRHLAQTRKSEREDGVEGSSHLPKWDGNKHLGTREEGSRSSRGG